MPTTAYNLGNCDGLTDGVADARLAEVAPTTIDTSHYYHGRTYKLPFDCGVRNAEYDAGYHDGYEAGRVILR